jgi:hypothetical protein
MRWFAHNVVHKMCAQVPADHVIVELAQCWARFQRQKRGKSAVIAEDLGARAETARGAVFLCGNKKP